MIIVDIPPIIRSSSIKDMKFLNRTNAETAAMPPALRQQLKAITLLLSFDKAETALRIVF